MSKLPELSLEDLEKIERLKGIDKSADVSPEMYFLAEVGYYLGWDAIVAIETGVLDVKHAIDLVTALKKVWYSHLYEEALANFYSTKSAAAFNKGMKIFVNKSKVVE